MTTKAPSIYYGLALLVLAATNATATPPSQDDVNIYSSLCKIGTSNTYALGGEVSGVLGLIARRLLSGEAKLEAGAISNQMPDIKDEKNRLLALQSYQDCMYRYVDRFHASVQPKDSQQTLSHPSAVAPTVSLERRREIIFLANELEDFKNRMKKVTASLPETYYDKTTSTQKRPRDDTRILTLDNYSRYKAFQSPTGIPDFSNVSNSDIAILCDTFHSEVKSYYDFSRDYGRAFGLQPYGLAKEVSRICTAARRGR
jgi:hypothetical protein